MSDQIPDLLDAGGFYPLIDVVVSSQGLLVVSYQFSSTIVDGRIHIGDDGLDHFSVSEPFLKVAEYFIQCVDAFVE